MDSKARMLKTWNFEEPDRVPVEVYLYPPAKDLPGADEIRDFQENEADNFCRVPGFNWGFLGLESEYFEEVIEDVPGDFKRIKRTQSTAAGDFTAIVRFNYDDADVNDCHWEKRYIETLSDFRRVAEHKRTVRPFALEAYNAGCIGVGVVQGGASAHARGDVGTEWGHMARPARGSPHALQYHMPPSMRGAGKRDLGRGIAGLWARASGCGGVAEREVCTNA